MNATDAAASASASASDPALEAALNALLSALADLERAIDAETLALTEHATEPLLAAVDAKRRALAGIEGALRAPRLHFLLSRPGHAPAEADAALARSECWPRVLEKLEACRAMNQAVGGALAAARRGTEEGLRLLGLAPPTDTYSDTRRPSSPRGRDLAVC